MTAADPRGATTALLGDVEVMAGSERVHRRWPRALAVVLVVAGAATWAVAALVSQRATDALLTEAGRAAAAVASADARISGMVAYASPALSSGEVAPSVRADLRRLVGGSAADGIPDVRAARDAVRAVRVPPWRTDLAAARERLAEYLDDRLARLQEMSLDYPAGAARDGSPSLAAARDALAVALGGDAGAADRALLVPAVP